MAKTDKDVKNLKAKWGNACLPVMRKVIELEGVRTADTYAKVIKNAPMKSRGILDLLKAKGKADEGLSNQIQETLGIGKYKYTDPNKAGNSLLPGVKPQPYNYTTIAIIIIVVILLGVGAYFLMQD